MPNPVRPHPALALLAHETRLREGPVARDLDGFPVPEDGWRLNATRFIFRSATGLGYSYARGEGVTAERPAGWDSDEDELRDAPFRAETAGLGAPALTRGRRCRHRCCALLAAAHGPERTRPHP